jgi:hypothetical protein
VRIGAWFFWVSERIVSKHVGYEYSVLTRLREFVLNDLSSAPFEMRPCVSRKRKIMSISKQSQTTHPNKPCIVS